MMEFHVEFNLCLYACEIPCEILSTWKCGHYQYNFGEFVKFIPYGYLMSAVREFYIREMYHLHSIIDTIEGDKIESPLKWSLLKTLNLIPFKGVFKV